MYVCVFGKSFSGHHKPPTFPCGKVGVIICLTRCPPCPLACFRYHHAAGGLKYIFLTHRDDVSDHAKWAERFPDAVRIIHKAEINRRQGTDKVERQLDGEGPWQLDDAGDHQARSPPTPPLGARFACGPAPHPQRHALQVLFVPGHTPGCLALHYTPSSCLFTGDTLAWSPRAGRLSVRQPSI